MAGNDGKINTASTASCRNCASYKPTKPIGGDLHGWRLVASAGGLFISPIAMAILGATIAGSSQTSQFVGASLGLGFTLIAAVVLGRLLGRTGKEAA